MSDMQLREVIQRKAPRTPQHQAAKELLILRENEEGKRVRASEERRHQEALVASWRLGWWGIAIAVGSLIVSIVALFKS